MATGLFLLTRTNLRGKKRTFEFAYEAAADKLYAKFQGAPKVARVELADMSATQDGAYTEIKHWDRAEELAKPTLVLNFSTFIDANEPNDAEGLAVKRLLGDNLKIYNCIVESTNLEAANFTGKTVVIMPRAGMAVIRVYSQIVQLGITAGSFKPAIFSQEKLLDEAGQPVLDGYGDDTYRVCLKFV